MNLIVLIILILVIRSVIKKNQEKSGATGLPGQSRGKSGLPGGGSPVLPGAGARGASDGSYASAARKEELRRAKRQQEQAKREEKLTKAGERESVSTTEYLRQKAKEDQIEHAREAHREEQRLKHETGGRSAAMRHYDGDSVPKGMRIVACRYCGAENLIQSYAKQDEYTCYFCRETL